MVAMGVVDMVAKVAVVAMLVFGHMMVAKLVIGRALRCHDLAAIVEELR